MKISLILRTVPRVVVDAVDGEAAELVVDAVVVDAVDGDAAELVDDVVATGDCGASTLFT